MVLLKQASCRSYKANKYALPCESQEEPAAQPEGFICLHRLGRHCSRPRSVSDDDGAEKISLETVRFQLCAW